MATTSTSHESPDLGPAHSQAASERGGVRARRCSNDEGRASKNVERPPISPAVGFDSASRHAPVMLRSPQEQPGERRPMLVSRGAERMARPSQIAPRMQVQSAIASPPACGRVCAQLSCLVLHARTLRPPLSTSRAADVRPRRCTAVTAASQSLAGRCGHARSTGAPESARTGARRLGPLGRRQAHAALFRDPVHAVAARSPRADHGKRLVGLRQIGQRAPAGFAGTDGAWCRGAQELCV